MDGLSHLLDSVLEYLDGTEARNLWKKRRELLQTDYINSPLHTEDIDKRFEIFSLILTKGLPNIIDASSIALSIFSQEPRYLVGIGIGEIFRHYLNTTYENSKDTLKKDIHLLEGLINN